MNKKTKKPFEVIRQSITENCGYLKIKIWGRIALVKIYNNHEQERALMADLERIKDLANLMIEVN